MESSERHVHRYLYSAAIGRVYGRMDSRRQHEYHFPTQDEWHYLCKLGDLLLRRNIPAHFDLETTLVHISGSSWVLYVRRNWENNLDIYGRPVCRNNETWGHWVVPGVHDPMYFWWRSGVYTGNRYMPDWQQRAIAFMTSKL